MVYILLLYIGISLNMPTLYYILWVIGAVLCLFDD